MESQKIIIEKHSDGYVAYPLGLKGVIVAEGDSYEEALADGNRQFAFISRRLGMTAYLVWNKLLI